MNDIEVALYNNLLKWIEVILPTGSMYGKYMLKLGV